MEEYSQVKVDLCLLQYARFFFLAFSVIQPNIQYMSNHLQHPDNIYNHLQSETSHKLKQNIIFFHICTFRFIKNTLHPKEDLSRVCPCSDAGPGGTWTLKCFGMLVSILSCSSDLSYTKWPNDCGHLTVASIRAL